MCTRNPLIPRYAPRGRLRPAGVFVEVELTRPGIGEALDPNLEGVRQVRITAHLNARKQRPRIGHNLEQSSDCPGPSTRPPELRAGIIPENGPGLSIGSTVDPTIAQVLRSPNAAGRDQDDGRCDEKSCRSRLWWVPTVRVICSWQKGDNLIGPPIGEAPITVIIGGRALLMLIAARFSGSLLKKIPGSSRRR